MEKALLETQIVDEILTRLHKQGLFQTDELSDEAIAMTREHLKIGVRLVLDDNNITA